MIALVQAMGYVKPWLMLQCTDIGWRGGVSTQDPTSSRTKHSFHTGEMCNLRYSSGPPGVALTLTKLPSVGICLVMALISWLLVSIVYTHFPLQHKMLALPSSVLNLQQPALQRSLRHDRTDDVISVLSSLWSTVDYKDRNSFIMLIRSF